MANSYGGGALADGGRMVYGVQGPQIPVIPVVWSYGLWGQGHFAEMGPPPHPGSPPLSRLLTGGGGI